MVWLFVSMYDACEAIVPLVNPLFYDVLSLLLGLHNLAAIVVYKKSPFHCHVYFYICDLSLEVTKKFQENNNAAYRFPLG